MSERPDTSYLRRAFGDLHQVRNACDYIDALEADRDRRERWWAEKHESEQRAAMRMVEKVEADRDRLVEGWEEAVRLCDRKDQCSPAVSRAVFALAHRAKFGCDKPGCVLNHAALNEQSEGGRVTHGRHCLCGACRRQDWTEPQLAPCGVHGEDCPGPGPLDEQGGRDADDFGPDDPRSYREQGEGGESDRQRARREHFHRRLR